MPVFGELPNISDEDSSSVKENEEVALYNDAPNPYFQKVLNYLVHDLVLSKSSVAMLESSL